MKPINELGAAAIATLTVVMVAAATLSLAKGVSEWYVSGFCGCIGAGLYLIIRQVFYK